MKLKRDADGHVVLENDLPIWVADDGKEIAYDVPKLVGDLSRVNGESAGRRKEIDELNAKLKEFDGLDIAQARTALETVGNLEAGKLMDAGKVEELKKSIAGSYEARIAALQKANEATEKDYTAKIQAKESSIRNLMVRGAFDRSVFLKEKTVLPPDIALQSFGQYCDVVDDNGTLRNQWHKPNGEPIYSRANPGTPATDEEAIEALIDGYSMKDRILKAALGGSGTSGSNSAGGKTITRSEFDKLDPARRMQVVTKDGFTVVD